MTTEAQEQTKVDESTTTSVDATKTVTTVEEALAEIERLKNITKEVIATRDSTKQKLRTFEAEQEAKEKAKLEEQGQYKELLEAERKAREALETKFKSQAINTALKAQVAESGARSLETTLKLIDKSQIQTDENGEVVLASIQSQLAALKQSDPILFGEPTEAVKVPPVKRATEGERTGSFEIEIRQAKTAREIEAVMAKYQNK